jgi:hypothetical protein
LSKVQSLVASGAKAPVANANARSNARSIVNSGAFRRSSDAGNVSIHTGRPVLVRQQPAVAPEKILQAFNTWAFKREQPDNAAVMLQVIAEATKLGKPVPFVLYWGKGPRCELAEPDTTCLDYLDSLAARVKQVYAPGVAFKLIFTDTHATLNGHAPEAMEAYFTAVEHAARARGFDSCWLSELVFAAEAADAIDLEDEPISAHVREKLGACAAKWFRGEGTVEEGADRYLQMNMIEKRAVQHAFSRAIFVTFNGSDYRCLFPEQMPIFYMYSLRRGMAVKPWFLPAPAPAAVAQVIELPVVATVATAPELPVTPMPAMAV